MILSDQIDPTAGSSSALDSGGSFNWSSGLDQLLNAYTQIEVAKNNQAALPAPNQPTQFQRVPGTGATVAAGTFQSGISSASPLMLAIGAGVLLVVVWMVAKK